MKTNMIPLNYANDLIFELQKAFWDERGKGARFRFTTVGRKYFDEKVLPLLVSPEVDHIISTVGKVLSEDGLVQEITFNPENRLIKISVKECLHRPVEDHFIAHGIEPCVCLPANLVVLAIENMLGCPVELAEIKLEDGACQLTLIIFDQRPDPE